MSDIRGTCLEGICVPSLVTFPFFSFKGKVKLKSEAPLIRKESALCVLTAPPPPPRSISCWLPVVFPHNEGDEGICQQIMGAQDRPPGLSAKFRLSAATARKFKSVGGILKTHFIFLVLG